MATAPQVFLTDLPWRPQCSVLEGMFLINTTPLGSHTTLMDYANFLIKRFIVTQFSNGSSEVHVVFDNPGRNIPKYFEQSRSDQVAKIAEDHHFDDLVSTTKIPGRWHEGLLHCCTCKCSLVKFLTSFFLSNISNYMEANQIFYTAGGFDGADTRVWIHIQQTQCRQVLLMSWAWYVHLYER